MRWDTILFTNLTIRPTPGMVELLPWTFNSLLCVVPGASRLFGP